MAQNKTTARSDDVATFIGSIADDRKREDSRRLCALMEEASGEPATMWGSAIIGFGRYHYRYESGREGEMCRIGFSPRASALTLYIMSGFAGEDTLMSRLGKHKTGKSCLYVKRLSDVDEGVLRELIDGSLAYMKNRYPD